MRKLHAGAGMTMMATLLLFGGGFSGPVDPPPAAGGASPVTTVERAAFEAAAIAPATLERAQGSTTPLRQDDTWTYIVVIFLLGVIAAVAFLA